MRPKSLKEVADRLRKAEPFWKASAEFCDEFYRAPDADAAEAMLAEEPPWTNNIEFDAVLAAIADHLSTRYLQRQPPEWASEPRRALSRPLFPAGFDDEEMKAWLFWNTPEGFRRHNVYTEEHPLRRKMSGRIPWAPAHTWDEGFEPVRAAEPDSPSCGPSR